MLTHDPRFVPPFCPLPDCRFHRDPSGFRFQSHGTYRRKAAPHVIRRFRCLGCLRSFSTQTFDTTYYLKRPDIQPRIFDALLSCVAHRQAARALGVTHGTVQRQASRLGRHCLLFERERGPKQPPAEPLALDGFVTFELSQYWPFEINTLVGTQSLYWYAFTDSELRRSGRMKTSQKARRAELEGRHGRPAPQATRDAVEALIRLVAPGSAQLEVVTDEHLAYPRAFRRLPHLIRHQTCSSRRCRTARNPLHAVDLLDLLLRHGGANHERETIAFSKRRQGALERAAVTQVWRNHVKRVRENERLSPTPAMQLGLAARPLTPGDVLLRRLFITRTDLPEPLRRYYWRLVTTRQLPRCTRHSLLRAA